MSDKENSHIHGHADDQAVSHKHFGIAELTSAGTVALVAMVLLAAAFGST